MMVHSPLLALALLSQPAQKSILIRDLDGSTASAVAAANATHAIVRQLASRPDLKAIREADRSDPQPPTDLVLEGGVRKIGSGYLGILVSLEGKTGRPITGESCRSRDENDLLACLIQVADRLARAAEPTPLGRAGGSIVVDALEGYEVKDTVATNVSGVVRIELQKAGGMRVVAEKGDWQVRGAVGRLDTVWVVALELLDPEGKLVNRTAEVFRGPQAELVQATRIAVRNLIGLPPESSGSLAMVTGLERAQLSIDGEPARDISRQEKMTLDAGKHHFELSAEGHRPLAHEFYVVGGQTTTLRPSLIELPSPWYEEWWIWTVLGVAVVASATVVGVAVVNEPEEAVIEVRVR
jgi:hypothetical protein